MVCTHIKELYRYAKKNNLKISAIDLISIECKKCKSKEECSSIPLE